MNKVKPQFFLVGGAVRDLLLNQLTPKDLDFVVVGATPEWMISNGFSQVGNSFPVFLHPKTGSEFALARNEIKTGTGYKGFITEFNPKITLNEDLKRRDLTINSMAMKVEIELKTGNIIFLDKINIIDPFNGLSDLKNNILRHTSIAFKEDPLRVLRLARFSARYNFKAANETIKLATDIVKQNELENLSIERIWNEIDKSFSENYPDNFLKICKSTTAINEKPLKTYFSDNIELMIKLFDKVRDKLSFNTYKDFDFKELKKNTLLLITISPKLLKYNKKTIEELKIPNYLNKSLDYLSILLELADFELKTPDDFLKILKQLKVEMKEFKKWPINLVAAIIVAEVLIENDIFKSLESWNKNFNLLQKIIVKLKSLNLEKVAATASNKKDIPILINKIKVDTILNII